MHNSMYQRLRGQCRVIQGISAELVCEHDATEAAAALVRRASTTRADTDGENQSDTHAQGRIGTNGHQHAPTHGGSTTRIWQPHPGDRSSARCSRCSGANATQVRAIACILTHLTPTSSLLLILFPLNSISQAILFLFHIRTCRTNSVLANILFTYHFISYKSFC